MPHRELLTESQRLSLQFPPVAFLAPRGSRDLALTKLLAIQNLPAFFLLSDLSPFLLLVRVKKQLNLKKHLS